MSNYPRRLTARNKRFVAEYLKDLNGAAAVRRIGSLATRPDQEAYDLLSTPEIAAAVAKGRAQQLAEAEITAVRVLEEVRRIAMVDPRDFFDTHGNVKAFRDLSRDVSAAIAGFEVVEKNAYTGDGVTDTVLKFKLAPKIQALELLCQHLGLLQPDQEAARESGPCFIMPEGTEIKIK